MTRTVVARSLGFLGLFAALVVVPNVTAQRGETPQGEPAQGEPAQGEPAQGEEARRGETAEGGDDARLTGTFRLDQSVDEANSVIHAEIDRAVEQMSFITRSFGRSRLQATNPAAQRIVVEIEGEQLAVAFDDEARYEAREGQWQNVEARGERSRLLMQRRPGRLYMTFRSENGQKRMVITASEDGRYAWLDVEVTSDRLPTPVTYRLPYRRAA